MGYGGAADRAAREEGKRRPGRCWAEGKAAGGKKARPCGLLGSMARGELGFGERREGWAAEKTGCWVLGFLSFLFLSPFSNKLKQHSNLIEFKPNLNSNPMHSTK